MVLQKLSPAQTSWIFNRARQLTDKYMGRMPLGREDWAELVGEMKTIIKQSREDQFTCDLLLVCLEYFEKLRKQEERKQV